MNKYNEELQIANAATWAASHTPRSAAWAANAANVATRSATYAATYAAKSAADAATNSEEELNYQIDKVLGLL